MTEYFAKQRLRLILLLVMVLALPSCAAHGRDVQSGYIRVAGGDSIWYDVHGSGPPVVLLHGGFIDSRLWDEQVKLPGFRWIRYDIRGFGRSPLPRATYAPVGDVLALLDHLGVRRAVLVGLSMGSSYALDFALEHPDRVAGQMLIAAGPSG